MKLNFLYPFFVGLHALFVIPDKTENIRLPGYVRTEIDTRYYFGLITLLFGNPPQRITALLDAQESAIVVLDANCVENSIKIQKTCKTYCRDLKFCRIHCHPVCCVSMQEIRNFCYHRTLIAYNQTATTTFHQSVNNSGDLWTSQYEGYRLQFGEYVQDTVALAGLGYRGSIVLMENATFVIFGFSPKAHNNIQSFVLRAYHSGLIQRPLLSLAYRTYVLNGAMTLGAEEPKYCQQNWTYYKVVDNEWILEVDGFEFDGKKHERKVKVHTQPFSEQIQLPSYLVQPMLDKGTLIYYQNEYIIDCASEIELTFNIHGKQYTLGPQQLVDRDPWEHYGMCVARFEVLKSKKYKETVDFVLGMPWFLRFCHTFDFEHLQIGLSLVKNNVADDDH
ncbi:hypothetical protein M3Y97_00642100 [Aphelenchoides bicaudatus]|nr:hypothetical protein M3Y97_00642100 [Aphelenchoides bicaudatus]